LRLHNKRMLGLRAIWYERQGPAHDVLVLGEMPDPEPDPGEVRLRIWASGINPGDVRKRQNSFGVGMPFPRVIPHSDGAGVIDRVGDGVPATRTGQRVWCYGAQTYRPFGTAAEYALVPAPQAVPLSDSISFEQGACLGISGITAHRAVHVAGDVRGRTVLVQGGAGAVGICAVGLARLAGARVIATVRSEHDATAAQRAGAHEVVRTDGRTASEVVTELAGLAPTGVDHVVEVAFDANVGVDVGLLKVGGSLSSYASAHSEPSIPFWPLVFKNVRVFFLGSDDFPLSAKVDAANAVNAMLEAGWRGFEIGERYLLEHTADAHASVETRRTGGRVVVQVSQVGA
jgi:NADPH2:quinone reductase